MKRSSLDQVVTDDSSLAEGETGVKPQKRRSSENKAWDKFFEEKQKDFAVLGITPSTSTFVPKPVPSGNESPVEDEFEIEEYDSPTKSLTNSDANQNTDTDGRTKKKHSLVEELKTILTPYENSVRRFPQHVYRQNYEYDESQAITLIVRYVCGKDDKLIWAICRLVERDEDRCVMFRPLDLFDVSLGAVLKLFPPWQELDMPGFPMPILMCTDFYRVPSKREKNFGVSYDTISSLLPLPVPFRSNYIKATSPKCSLPFLLSQCIPFHLSNQNTITIQVKAWKPSIDLNIVMYPASGPKWSTLSESCLLICDSDHLFGLLQLSDLESGKGERFYKAIKPGNYVKFKKLGVVSKTSVLEDFSWFPIFRRFGSNQTVYYTMCFRHDTEWKEEAKLDFPYQPNWN